MQVYIWMIENRFNMSDSERYTLVGEEQNPTRTLYKHSGYRFDMLKF